MLQTFYRRYLFDKDDNVVWYATSNSFSSVDISGNGERIVAAGTSKFFRFSRSCNATTFPLSPTAD